MTKDFYFKKKSELDELRREAGILHLEYIRVGRTLGRKKQQDWWVTQGNLRRYVNLIHKVQALDEMIAPYELCNGIRKINLQEYMRWHYLTF